MTKFIFTLTIFSILLIEISAQIKSNEYYEVIDSCINTEKRIMYIGDDQFIEHPYPLKNRGLVYLIDKDRNKIELPCEQLTWFIAYENYECIRNNKGALFSMDERTPISPFYDSISIISKDFYVVYQNDSIKIFNSKNELILPDARNLFEKKIYFEICNDHLRIFELNGGNFYLSKKGEVSENIDIPCERYKRKFYYRNGTHSFKKNKKWGLKNKNNEVLLEPSYDRIDHWRDNKYIVSISQGKGRGYLSGVINKRGRILLPIKFKQIKNFHDIGLSIREKDKYVFLNKKLKDVYRKEFDRLDAFECGVVCGKIGDQNFCDLLFTKKNEIKTAEISYAYEVSKNRSLVKYKNGLSVIHDTLGNVLFSSKELINSARHIIDDVIRISINAKLRGLMNAKGEWVVEPGRLHFEATHNKKGIFRTDQISKQRDLTNSKGELIYANVQSVRHPRRVKNFIVKTAEGEGVIDPKGKVLIPFGNYEVFEFYSIDPIYYRLTAGDMAYVIKLKK